MSKTLEITMPANNIGRLARIEIVSEGAREVVYGNVLDQVAGTDAPKRVRIQRGKPDRHGDVVMPHEYVFIGWADEEED